MSSLVDLTHVRVVSLFHLARGSPRAVLRRLLRLVCEFQDSDSDDAESGQSDDEQQRSVWASLDAEGFESFAPRVGQSQKRGKYFGM